MCFVRVQFTIAIYTAWRCRSARSASVLPYLCSYGDVHDLIILGSYFRHCAWIWSQSFPGSCTEV